MADAVRALVDQNAAPKGLRALHCLLQSLQLGRRDRLSEATMHLLLSMAKEELELLTAKVRSETEAGWKGPARS